MTPRPDVKTYTDASYFLRDMLLWRKEQSPLFSIRKEVAGIKGLSPTHVTLLAQGKRRFTSERAESVARLLGLSQTERNFLGKLCGEFPGTNVPKKERTQLQGNMLGQWFHLHIWESARLFDFRPHEENLFERLRGLASPSALQRGFDFLVHHGFLRRLPSGRIVPDAEVLESTDGIPNQNIQRFHAQSLRHAGRLTEELPPEQRESQTLLMSLSRADFEELRSKLKKTSEDLTHWATTKGASDAVYQVVLSAVPITTHTSTSEAKERKRK